MKYSIDRVHEIKEMTQRGNGKTVDILMNAIGMIMVTENEIVPIVVYVMDRAINLKWTFIDIVINHFKEVPVINNYREFGIKGYSSKIRVYSFSQLDEGALNGLRLQALIDD